MAEQYDPDKFDDLDGEFEALKTKPKKVSAYELIASKYDEIKSAVDRGVPLESVYKVLADRNLNIGYDTFAQYWRQIEKAKKKDERKRKREAKKALESLDFKDSGGEEGDSPPPKALKLRKVDPSKVPLPPPLVTGELVED